MGRFLLSASARWRIPVLYAAAGVLWVVVTDSFVDLWFPHESVAGIQSLKGTLFVIATAALFFVVMSLLAERLSSARSLLRASRLDFGRILDTAYEGIWIIGPDGRTLRVNERMARILGSTRDRLESATPEEFVDTENAEALRLALAEPRAGSPGQHEIQFRRADGGEAWTLLGASPIEGLPGARNDGHAVLLIASDISRQKRSEAALARSLESERALLRELNHRVRNNLQSLISLVDLTSDEAASARDLSEMIQGRIKALAAAHTLLAESLWQPVPMRQVMKAIFGARDTRAWSADGPDVRIPAHIAGPLTTVGHELVLNAVAHGGAVNAQHPVRLTWSIKADPSGPDRLAIEWRSRNLRPDTIDGPQAVSVALARGIVESDLRGRFSIETATPQNGVAPLPASESLCRIEVPLVDEVTAYAAQRLPVPAESQSSHR